jgi:uncharacterized protein (TIGR00255 family)
LIRSMTGFGEASSHAADGVHYFLEIRSLNSRYFKAVIRLPDEFQGLEAEVESELRRRLTRGSVTLAASCTDVSAGAAYTINHKALAAYIQQLQETPQISGGQVKVEIAPLLSLPGVLQPPANEEARLDRARAEFLKLLTKAAGDLIKMRAKEGAALLEDLLAQRDLILERLKIIRERAPQVVQDYELRLRNRIEMMLRDADLKIDSVDIIREIAVYAERSDISEEITRLGGHMEQYTQLLTNSEDKPVGRTLDFLAQEMLREANTMASKSSDTGISRAIVEIKGAIDRIKEQVQNIE